MRATAPVRSCWPGGILCCVSLLSSRLLPARSVCSRSGSLTIPATVPASALLAHAPDLMTNGKVLFNAGGCVSCHNVPGEKNKEEIVRLGGGLGSSNHHSERSTRSQHLLWIAPMALAAGLEAQFVYRHDQGNVALWLAFVSGIPYVSYQRMSYDDVRDLFAYLKTLPAVQGQGTWS